VRLNKRIEITIDRDESEGLVDEESEKSCYMFEVIEEFWGPCYQHFRGGVCDINQHEAS
jgi:hypothetical protein